MLVESKEHFGEPLEEEEDEFEDINYFLELSYNNDSDSININLLPFDLYLKYPINYLAIKSFKN